MRDIALTILEKGTEKSTSMERAIKANGAQEGPGTGGDTRNSRQLSLSQETETVNNENDKFIVEKIIHISHGIG